MGGILENQKREIEEIWETLKKCPGKQRNHKIDWLIYFDQLIYFVIGIFRS